MAVKAPPPRSVGRTRTIDVEVQIAHDKARARIVYAAIIVLTVMMGAVAYTRAPEPFPIALLVLTLSCICAFLRPAAGIYVLVFLTMVGDAVTMPWWPFTKNMSSRESIFYVNDNVFMSPLELLAAVTLIAWLLRSVADPTWRFVRGRMFWPIVVFTGFVVVGFARGIASGGDKRIAIFEGRALFYVLVMYVLVTNLLTTRRQYVRLVMVAMVGVAIQSIFSLEYYRGLPDAERASLESLGEHSATVPMNALFVLLIGAVVFKGSRWLRWSTFVLAIPVAYAYILSNRRAAMVALFVGIIIIIAVLFQRRRRAFWIIAPTTVLVGLGFVLATWNASGAIGLPAKAVKTVLFPNDLSERDSSSDLYRQLESANLYYTIQSNRLFGVGFGHKFLQVIPMPDISFFEFWEYIPHNNVLWIWIKLGFFGFVAMLFMFGRCVQLGARSVTLIQSADHVAFAVVGLAYVVMFLVFAYVDIAWDARSTVFLGVSMALCADFVQVRDIDEESHRTPAFVMVPQ
jgi:O-antigen ligase